MSNENIKPFQFVSFDSLDEKEESDPLLKFKIDREKDFIPQFKKETKYEFRNLFSEKGELTSEDYKREVEEYYNKKKEEAELEIKRYLEEKKKEADLIIKNAEENAEKIKKEAYDKGYNQGFNEGLKKGEAEIAKNIEELRQLISNLKDFELKIIKDNEINLSRLIIKFAKKIIKKELDICSDEILLENLRNVLSKIVDKGYILIKINPSQYQFLQKHIENFKDLFDIKEIEILRSNEISLGSCIVETNFGNYDSRIEEQINELEKALTE